MMSNVPLSESVARTVHMLCTPPLSSSSFQTIVDSGFLQSALKADTNVVLQLDY